MMALLKMLWMKLYRYVVKTDHPKILLILSFPLFGANENVTSYQINAQNEHLYEILLITIKRHVDNLIPHHLSKPL